MLFQVTLRHFYPSRTIKNRICIIIDLCFCKDYIGKDQAVFFGKAFCIKEILCLLGYQSALACSHSEELMIFFQILMHLKQSESGFLKIFFICLQI